MNFDGAILVNTDFREAWLSSVGDRTTTFKRQPAGRAVHPGAILENVDFTDAAMAVEDGVPLFNVSDALAADLDAAGPKPGPKPVPQSVTDVFAARGYTLLPIRPRTWSTPAERWLVRNGGDAPPASGTGGIYATFTLRRDGAALAVSGTSLWVVGVDGSGHFTSSEILYSATVLPVANDLPKNVKLPRAATTPATGRPAARAGETCSLRTAVPFSADVCAVRRHVLPAAATGAVTRWAPNVFGGSLTRRSRAATLSDSAPVNAEQPSD